MNNTKYDVTLDLVRSVSPVVLRLRRGDTARELRVKLEVSGEPYEVAEGCVAVCCAKLPDGTTSGVALTDRDGALTALIPAEWTERVGGAECEVRVYDRTGERKVTSPRFSLIVSGTLFDGAQAEIYYGLFVLPEAEIRKPGALAFAKSVVPAEEPVTFTVADGSSKHLVVAVPTSLGLTPSFERDGHPYSHPSTTAIDLVDRYGTVRNFTCYDASAPADVWTVTVPGTGN